MTNLDHLNSLRSHGAYIKAGDQRIELTEEFFRKAVEQCERGGYNAVTYELVLPGITEEMGLCIWRDGHVDSGSMRRICDCLAR